MNQENQKSLKDKCGQENFEKLVAIQNRKLHEFIEKYVLQKIIIR